jgi:hypothetical protein
MRLIALAILVSALPAAAKEREGVTSEPTIRAGGKQLNLMGMGLRKKLWFKVYIASFYLENPTEDAAQAVSSDQVKRVEMRMLRDLERGKIVEAVQAGFEKNSAAQMPQLQARLDTFLKAIPDLKAGGSDEIAIPGKDFADALFSVWLGPHPVDDELKNEMLKNH